MKTDKNFGVVSVLVSLLFLFSGHGVEAFSGGSGTADDPYRISDCEQLQSVADGLDSYYVLDNDVDCSMTDPDDADFDSEGTWGDSAGFEPIGASGTPFTGSFDGNGKTIEGLFIDRSGTDYVGLFGFLSVGGGQDSGVVKDLNLTGADIHGDDRVGILVGKMSADTSVRNVSVSGDIGADDYVGGLGGVSLGTVSGCRTEIDLVANDYVGGLIGALTGSEGNLGTISDSSSAGTVRGGAEEVGGLVGVATEFGDIENAHSSAMVDGWWTVGGLVGTGKGAIEDSYATGTVSAEAYGSGGLVGYLWGGTVSRSYATGGVTAGNDGIYLDQSSSFAGGLVGISEGGEIRESYATGDVMGDGIRVGGLVGGTDSVVQNCYALGNVTGKDRIGGLVGGSTGEITNSYSIGEVAVAVGGESSRIMEDGGGGGGGYWGGEGGQSDAGPGGGGSGYLHPVNISDGILTAGNDGAGPDRAAPPQTGDSDYVDGVGVGGDEAHGGGNGLVVIGYDVEKRTFSYTGSGQTFTIPEGVTSVDVKVWGAGGGGSDYSNSYQGGSGGFASGTLSVAPGENLVVIVGGGGGLGDSNDSGGEGGYGGGGDGTLGDASGGGGGGLSGLFDDAHGNGFESLVQSDSLIIAGGGGGGTGYSGAGGAGGGEEGNDSGGGHGGCGGTQTAGGSCLEFGSDGTALHGGAGDSRGSIDGIVETDPLYRGGLVGYNGGTVVGSYWDTDVSGLSVSNGGTGKNTAEMKTRSTFVDWDFVNIWNLYSGANSGYPVLRWQPDGNGSDGSDGDDEEEDVEKASITSWKASLRENTKGVSCPVKVRLEIKGKRFDKRAEVKIGGTKAASVERQSSKKIIAKFCQKDLLSVKTDPKRTVKVINPGADVAEARKKIDIEHIERIFSGIDFHMGSSEGIRSIQTALVKLGYLDAKYVTGSFGPITAEAVGKFQADNGLPQTGYCGSLTSAKLGKLLGN